MTAIHTSSSRRIFIRSKDRLSQLFSFAQKPDGSIYCASPDFEGATWVTVDVNARGGTILQTSGIGKGKLSLHGSGMAAIRPNHDPRGHRLIIKGNHLFNKEKSVIGARHLLTVFPKEPQYNPENSPLFNRESDYCIEAHEKLNPLVLVFFAVPQNGLSIRFNCSFHQDDLVMIPNDVLGLHGFGFRYHDVFWFAYRTKHMEKWPKESQICYHDGFTFPIFIGTGNGSYRLEFRFPKYSLVEKEFSILCHADYPDDYSNPGLGSV
jgi:hypothetical protein